MRSSAFVAGGVAERQGHMPSLGRFQGLRLSFFVWNQCSAKGAKIQARPGQVENHRIITGCGDPLGGRGGVTGSNCAMTRSSEYLNEFSPLRGILTQHQNVQRVHAAKYRV